MHRSCPYTEAKGVHLSEACLTVFNFLIFDDGCVL